MALDPTALFTLSYGLYVLTAREDAATWAASSTPSPS